MFEHLDGLQSGEGYWHDVSIFEHAIVDILHITKPRYFLEIGMNIGYSATMWLEFGHTITTLTAIDIGKHSDTGRAATALKNKYRKRFEFIMSDSKNITQYSKPGYFGAAFIDGDHGYQGVKQDIESCLELQIPWLVFDDYHTPPRPATNGVHPSCDEYVEAGDLELVKVYDLEIVSKIALFKNTRNYENND